MIGFTCPGHRGTAVRQCGGVGDDQFPAPVTLVDDAGDHWLQIPVRGAVVHRYHHAERGVRITVHQVDGRTEKIRLNVFNPVLIISRCGRTQHAESAGGPHEVGTTR